MTLKLPDEFEGINGKEAYERILAEAEKQKYNKEQEEKREQQDNQIPQDSYQPEKDTKNFIYVPSLDLYFTNQRILTNHNWSKCHEALNNSEIYNTKMKMPTIPEFWEFLRYLNNNKENNEKYKEVFNDITEVKNPLGGEWLNADFKYNENNGFSVNYHAFDSQGEIIQKSESFDSDTLLKSKTPGISLEKILYRKDQLTKQGLPNKNTEPGNLYYFTPMNDNNSVAWFDTFPIGAHLGCIRNPSVSDPSLGVFGVAQYLNDNAH